MSFINYQAPSTFRSSFIPVIGFSQEVRHKVEDFMEARIMRFFSSMGLDYDEAEFIQLDETITDKEFQNTSTELANSYFYQILFTNPEKENDGSISESIKFAITFDKELTPSTIDNISFGTIKISNRPVLYYILFDLQELIRVSKA